MNGIVINREREKRQFYNWLMYKVHLQSKKILEDKAEAWKTRKDIDRYVCKKMKEVDSVINGRI